MRQYQFSANTGFLWPHLTFPEKILMAKHAGFDALEFHDEAQNTDLGALKNVLDQTGLPVLGMNVKMGQSMGCAAIPDRMAEARQDILNALDVATVLGVENLHILAGQTRHRHAFSTYVEALKFAVDASDVKILIEPISRAAAPDYFLNDIETAIQVIKAVDHPNISIMFDCYHILMEGCDLATCFKKHKDKIGHIQIAARKNRADPGLVDPDYSQVLPQFKHLGYTGAFGCEFHQIDAQDLTQNWRDDLLAAIGEKGAI